MRRIINVIKILEMIVEIKEVDFARFFYDNILLAYNFVEIYGLGADI